MMAPTTPAMLVTPICPHSLSFRPLILPDDAVVRICVPRNTTRDCQVAFDGREAMILHPVSLLPPHNCFPLSCLTLQRLAQGDRLEVRMSRFPFPSINLTGLYSSALLFSRAIPYTTRI